jgi:hypothetical protein
VSIASDVRFTPQHVLDVVREFEVIALDPCTTPQNPVGAKVFCDVDGLGVCWSGFIADWAPAHVPFAFVNPPYSRGELLKWARKAVEEWRRNQVESICLVPADTSTRASQLLLAEANAVAFWRHRICFAGEQGAKFANALYYFGDRQGRFRRVFERWATVLVLR